MELFMEKTAYAAGNYAKENDTLAGSLNTAKAAWDNFISGAGDIDGFVDAAVNAGDIIVDKLTGIVPRLVSGISGMVTKIAPKIPGMVQQLLPALITGAVALLTSAVDILPQMLGILTEAVPLVITALSGAIPGALPGLVPAIVEVLLLFVATLTDPGNLALLTYASIAIIFGLADGLIAAVPMLIQQAPVIVSNLVTAIVENAPKLLVAAGELIAQLIIGFGDNFQSMIDAGGEIIANVLTGINDAYNDLLEAGKDVINTVWEGMKSAWNSVVSWFKNAFANLTSGLTVNVNANVTGKAAYTGLEYVPYDNYPIIAHKGEAVLTKSEAESWRNGESGGKGSGGITIVQNISAVPQTPVETAAATAAYFEQARWAFT
jgi:phage-related protein